MYNLIVNDGKTIRKEFPLNEQITVIGREEGCHIILDSKTISKKHFRIISKGLKIYVEDLNSTNGVSINDQKIEKITEITENDIIQFGVYFAQLNNTNKLKKSYKVDEVVAQKQNDSLKKNSAPYFKLICIDKRYPGLTFEIQDGISAIGRTKKSDFVLPDDTLSGRHLQLTKTGPKLFIEDLDSANGSMLNSRKVRGKLQVFGNDKIEIGSVAFSVESNIEKTVAKKSPKKLIMIIGGVLGFSMVVLFLISQLKSDPSLDTKNIKPKSIEDKIESRDKEIQKKVGFAELAATKGNWDEAIKYCNEVTEMDPANERVKTLLVKYKGEADNYLIFKEGRQAIDLYDFEKAMASLSKIPKGTYYSSDATMLLRQAKEELMKKYYKDARSFRKAKRFKDAYEQLKKLFELTPGYEESVDLKSKLENDMKDYGIKYEKFEIKIETDTEGSMGEDKFDKKALVAKYPEHEVNTAVEYFIGGDIQRSLKFLSKVGASHKSYQACQDLTKKLQLYKNKFDIGNSEFINKNYSQAREAWLLALDIEKELLADLEMQSKYAKQMKYNLSEGFNELGQTALKNERYKSAYKHFKESHEFNPNNTQNLQDMAKMKELATKFWNKSLDLEQKGDKKAFSYWEAIISITDETEELHKNASAKISGAGK